MRATDQTGFYNAIQLKFYVEEQFDIRPFPLRRHPPPARSHQEGDQTRGRRPGPQDHQARLQQTRQPRLRAEALPKHRHQK